MSLKTLLSSSSFEEERARLTKQSSLQDVDHYCFAGSPFFFFFYIIKAVWSHSQCCAGALLVSFVEYFRLRDVYLFFVWSVWKLLPGQIILSLGVSSVQWKCLECF